MQIIIPMAGIGERFQKAGYKDPKPLIPVDERPLIEHVAAMFPGDNEFIFICNENHIRDTELAKIIANMKLNAKIVPIAQHKLGPVYTVLQAKDHIDEHAPTFICYCDVNVHWDFNDFKQHVTDKGADAALVTFKGFHPPLLKDGFYATARIDDTTGEVLEVREKFSFTPDKMDSWTSAGMHYFKDGMTVKKYFERLIERNITCNNEFYISLIHNLLIEDGMKNIIYPVDFFISWGKPEDVKEYIYWSNHFKS